MVRSGVIFLLATREGGGAGLGASSLGPWLGEIFLVAQGDLLRRVKVRVRVLLLVQELH